MEISTNLLSELHSGAVNQIDNEFFELEKFLRDDATPEEVRVINAALNLRRLDEGLRVVELYSLIFGLDGRSTRYSCLYRIADSSHFTTIASDLLNLIERLTYDILDDGYLRLVRVKMNYQTFKVGVGEEHFRYFLSCREDFTMKKIEDAVRRHSVFPFHIVKVKKMWFGDIDKFASFLALLADGFDSKDPYQDKLAKRIDELMEPETYEDWEEGQ